MSEKVRTRKNNHRDISFVKEKSVSKKEQEVGKKFLNKVITKKNIFYFILVILDIIFILYAARRNVVHYAEILDQEIIVGGKKRLFFGRNYITILVTLFFYLYICLVNRFFFKSKNTKVFLLGWLIFLVVLNGLLFFIFTKRVY